LRETIINKKVKETIITAFFRLDRIKMDILNFYKVEEQLPQSFSQMGIENDFRKSKEIEKIMLGNEGSILVKFKGSIAKNLVMKLTPKIIGVNDIKWSCETNYKDKLTELCNKASLSQELFIQKIVYKKRKLIKKADEARHASTDKLGIDRSYKKINASHILVKTKEEALKIIEDLSKGADFAKVAKEKSIGKSSSKGGSLGWLSANQMVYSVSKAISRMIKGETSKEPVLSELGYHVIKLEGIRFTKEP